MAEKEGGWWDSWYKAAKDKSVEVLQFVKRDLDELSTAVRSEASSVVTTTTTALKERLRLDEPDSTAGTMKRSVSSFIGQVSNALSPVPDDEDEEALIIHGSEPLQLTRLQARLHALILDPSTFLTEPGKEYCSVYPVWWAMMVEKLTPERMTRMLARSPELHMQYTKLVPDQVQNMTFWQRFLFRKALLEDEEARNEAIKKREEREKREAENFQWDQEEEFGSNIELSEEEQIRLLAEYEKECEEKRLRAAADLLPKGAQDNHYSEDIPKSQSEPSLRLASRAALETEENEPAESLRVREKRDMVIVGESSSCHTSSSSGDKESNDEDWEREFDLEEPEEEVTDHHPHTV